MKTFIFFILLVDMSVISARAQSVKSSTLLLQVGFGGSISNRNYSDPVINTSLDYERVFYTKKAMRLGAHAGAGVWLAPRGFFGIENTQKIAHHFELSGCMKLGGQKHFFAMDGGYAYVNWGERNSEIKHYHIPTLTLSYQYQAVKGFHARFGISSWRGLVVGLGKRF